VKRIPSWVRLGRMGVFRAPVFVHWSVFAVVGLMSLVAVSSPLYAVLFIASYLGIIVVHEWGHAFVAHRLGYEIDSIGITALHGWCLHEAPHTEWDEVLIAWGGVAAQLAVALPVLVVMVVLGDRSWGYFTPAIVFLGLINVGIAVANLVPDDESDGRMAWRIIPLLMQKRRGKRAEIRRPGSPR
jgi:stage IV sporulation protein FB